MPAATPRVQASPRFLGVFGLLFLACGASVAQVPPDVDALRAEVARLRSENAQLRLSPAGLASEVDLALQGRNLDKAQLALHTLVERYPKSAEAAEARRRVDSYLAAERAAQDQARRQAALGFRALKVSPTFARGDVVLALADTTVARRWTFDSYGSGWRFIDAERGQRFLIARLTTTARTKNPALFGIAAYVPDGPRLVRLGNLRYRFSRWSDYGAFLGNHADFRNDFSHTARIPFTAAVAFADDEWKRRPVYLVATGEGCHRRGYDRFGQPPAFYQPGECASLKPILTLDDFKDGFLAVLKRME